MSGNDKVGGHVYWVLVGGLVRIYKVGGTVNGHYLAVLTAKMKYGSASNDYY